MPEVILPPGTFLEQQVYPLRKLRPFCSSAAAELTCPKPYTTENPPLVQQEKSKANRKENVVSRDIPKLFVGKAESSKSLAIQRQEGGVFSWFLCNTLHCLLSTACLKLQEVENGLREVTEWYQLGLFHHPNWGKLRATTLKMPKKETACLVIIDRWGYILQCPEVIWFN